MARISDLSDDQLAEQIVRHKRLLAEASSPGEVAKLDDILARLRSERARRKSALAPVVPTRPAPNVDFDAGIMALKSSRYGEAEQAFLAAARLNPQLGDAWSAMGICKLYQLAEGRTTEEALYAFRRAKEVEPARATDVDRLVIEHASIVISTYYDVLSASIKAARGAADRAALGMIITAASAVVGMTSSRTFTQLVAFGGSVSGVGVSVQGLAEIRDLKQLQMTVVSLVLAIRDAVVEFVDHDTPHFTEFQSLIAQLEFAHSGKGHRPLLTKGAPQSVGFWLGLGILLCPYIFAWVTLKDGYSRRARVIAFCWLAFLVMSMVISGIANSSDAARRNSSAGIGGNRSRLHSQLNIDSNSGERVQDRWDVHPPLQLWTSPATPAERKITSKWALQRDQNWMS